MIGIFFLENRLKVGCSGIVGLEGGFGYFSKVVNDGGRFFIDCFKFVWLGFNLLLKIVWK